LEKVKHFEETDEDLDERYENEPNKTLTKLHKDRTDHRHHLIDAIIIACTSPKEIKMLSNYNKKREIYDIRDENGFPKRDKVEKPWKTFYTDVKEILKYTLVSYKKEKKLLKTKNNKTKFRDPETGKLKYKPQLEKPRSLMGSLHDDSIYGLITNPDTKNEHYVIKKKIIELVDPKNPKSTSRIERIVDRNTRELLLKRIKEFNGNVKEAFKENKDKLIRMLPKDDKLKVKFDLYPIIKSVRVISENERNKFPARKLKVNNSSEVKEKYQYVESQNNYLLAIYEGEKMTKRGNRAFELVEFYKAVQRAKEGKLLFPREKEGKKLLYYLQQNDMVILYDKHKDEIENYSREDISKKLYRVTGLSSEEKYGIIFLCKHNCINKKLKNIDNKHLIRIRHTGLNAVKVKVDFITGNIIRLS
jgi:CRISPR-associated endonuclease Csn1